MDKNIKVLAISGSLRDNSSNLVILQTLAGMLSNAHFVFYDGLGSLPHFSPDLDNKHPHQSIVELRRQIKNAGVVIICTPEYAFGIPGSLKNAIDWTVSSGELVDKPVALITASSQGTHAHAALILVLQAISAKLIEEATLLIPFIRSKINQTGEVTHAETLISLKKVAAAIENVLR